MAKKANTFKRKSYSKLFLGHLTVEENCFYIGDEIVTHVDVLGTVVSVSSLRDNTFEIDDGTGMISCICFGNDRNACQSSEILNLTNQLHIQIEELGA